MNATQLLAHFDRLAEAPNAVPRLRRFILDLAVRGKLVAQDGGDEPATKLLMRIRTEKARLVETGSLKASKPQPATEVVDSSLIPGSWQWTRLVDVGFISPRNTAPDDQLVSFVPMPMIAADYGTPNQHEIRPWREIKTGYTHFGEGDVGLAKITPCFENGKSTVFRGLTNGIGAGTTELHIVRPVFLSADYILIYLKSSQYIATGIPRMTGTAGQKRVPTEYFTQTPFPLPPLAEQHRIVAKVDELMTLCDQLEAAQQERERRRARLATASLQRLNQPNADTPSKAQREHARFHLHHLPRLTTRPEHIKPMRQTILNLAVRGKLVQQDSSEKSAQNSLLENDVARKGVASSDRRADIDAQELLEPELCWDVPATWAWRGLADLALFIDYRGQTPNKVEAGVRLITAKNVKPGFINLHPEEFLTEPAYDDWMTRGVPKMGDVLFTTEAPMGNAAVVKLPERFALAQRVINFRLYGAVDPHFLALQLISQSFQRILDKTATGLTAKGIKAAKLKRLPIAVPPLAEQQRIVAKVDELMALCDQLEAQLTTTQTDSHRLLEAVLEAALSPA